jgi:hypothetical protein
MAPAAIDPSPAVACRAAPAYRRGTRGRRHRLAARASASTIDSRSRGALHRASCTRHRRRRAGPLPLADVQDLHDRAIAGCAVLGLRGGRPMCSSIISRITSMPSEFKAPVQSSPCVPACVTRAPRPGLPPAPCLRRPPAGRPAAAVAAAMLASARCPLPAARCTGPIASAVFERYIDSPRARDHYSRTCAEPRAPGRRAGPDRGGAAGAADSAAR